MENRRGSSAEVFRQDMEATESTETSRLLNAGHVETPTAGTSRAAAGHVEKEKLGKATQHHRSTLSRGRANAASAKCCLSSSSTEVNRQCVTIGRGLYYRGRKGI